MMRSMNSMNIGMKLVVSLGCIAAVMMTVGLLFVFNQEEARMQAVLEEEGKMIQAQVEVTRAYIAKNYVGKMKKSSVGSEIVVSRQHLTDPQAIPFPATATQEIGKALSERGIFQARLFSDQPMNPANAPQDDFERTALQEIMAGANSYSSVETVNGELTYRRASADMASVQACVNCHVGKQVGDLIGLLSVSIPMAHAQEGMWASVTRTGSLLVGIILACLALVYVLIQKFVLNPLKSLTNISRDIAQGQGDLDQAGAHR